MNDGLFGLFRRGRLAGIAPVLLALAVAGCGGDDADERVAAVPAGGYQTFSGGPPGGTAVVIPPEGREPDNLNPLTFNSTPAYQVVHLLFRALAKRDTTLSDYEPDLARSWELGPDSTTLTLRLREDVKWHDDVPVTAEDVVFTIERQKDPRTASPRRGDVARVVSAEAVDSFTVQVELERPGPSTVNALLETVPVPKHLLDTIPPERMSFAAFSRNPVGNALFRFGEWRAGQDLSVVANPDAPEGRPALDRVMLRFVPDVNAAMTELLSGQADMVKVPPEQAERVRGSDRVELHSAPRVRPAWIAWNTDRWPVNDPTVRRALLMGVNRPELAEALFGDEELAALSPIPETVRQHQREIRPIPYDPQRARQLLVQAGWRDADGDGILEKGGRPLRVEVEYNAGDPLRQDALIAMQAMLRRIGVDLVPRPYESTAWVDRLRKREFQGSFWGWGWGPGVMGPNAEMVFHSRSIPPGGPNFAGYSNPRVDALVDSLLVTFDPARASRMWAQLEQQVINDAVYAPIFLDPEYYGVNRRIENVKFRGIEWWEDVPYWYIPQEERLPRDRP